MDGMFVPPLPPVHMLNPSPDVMVSGGRAFGR